jgi:hypothetical protein
MEIQWLRPWEPIEASSAAAFEAELKRELAPSHPLFGSELRAIGCGFGDDVLFQFADGSNRVAVVHLTWAGRVEADPRWPHTVTYCSLQDWVDRGMKPDNDALTAREAEFAHAADYVLKKNSELHRRLA